MRILPVLLIAKTTMNGSTLKVKIILGSTRPNRFSEKAGEWIERIARKRGDMDVAILDLREHSLPMYDEQLSPSMIRDGAYAKESVRKWAQKIAEADAYVIVAPEYNHGPSAVLKNALDHVYYEWNKKSVGFVSYGGVGGARSVEQLREIAVELQMAPIRAAVHIQSPWALLTEEGALKEGALDQHEQSAEAMLDQLFWWGSALRVARAGELSPIAGMVQSLNKK